MTIAQGSVRDLLLCIAMLGAFGCGEMMAQDVTSTDEVGSLWDKPAFTATSEELLKEATRLPPDEDGDAAVEILLDEGNFVFDHDGRLTREIRQVFLFRSKEAYDSHGIAVAEWSPWYQERPEIRARVISPTGQVRELDASTIEELRVPSSHPNIFTDRMLLRAPLPGLSLGAIAEVRIRTAEKSLFSSSGDLIRFSLASTDPIRRLRLKIDAPVSLPITHRVYGAEISPQVSTVHDRHVIRIDMGPVPAVTVIEAYTPSDHTLIPHLLATTGQSWSACAKEYAGIVERRLEGQSLDASLKELLADPSSQMEVITQIMKKVRSGIRYTGVEFGSAALVPQTPLETLSRGYGDCKDKATLAVGLLHAAGIDAHVALLDAGLGLNTPVDLPSLDHFNHAIVYVPARADVDLPELWIDPTDEYSSLTRLPSSDQGRHALIASHATIGLVTTPVSESSENVTSVRREFVLSDTSSNRLTVRAEYIGEHAREMRSQLSSMTEKQRIKWCEEEMDLYASERVESLEVTGLDDLDRPLIVTVQYQDPEITYVGDGIAFVILFPGEVLMDLPLTLTPASDDGTETDDSSDDELERPAARINPLQLTTPSRRSITYSVTPPIGFDSAELPEMQQIVVGPARFAMKVRAGDGGQVTIECELDTGDGRFTANEVEEMRSKTAALSPDSGIYESSLAIRFHQRAAERLASGDYKEALQEYYRLVQQEPDQAYRHAEFALALTQIGLVEAAREHAGRAVELDPQNVHAQHALGFVSLHNDLGQPLQAGFLRATSIAANRRALELDPERSDVRTNLGNVLARNEDATSPSSPDELLAAIDELKRVYDETHDESVLDALLTAIHHTGDRDVIAQVLESAEDSFTTSMHRLILAAKQEGISEVRKRAAREFREPTERNAHLRSLVMSLNYMREYELALELADQLQAETTVEDRFRNLTEFFRDYKRMEAADLEGSDPIHVARRFLAAALIHGEFHPSTNGLYHNPRSKLNSSIAIPELASWLEASRVALIPIGTSRLRRVDVLSDVTFDIDGNDDTGFRVRVTNPRDSDLQSDVFVIRNGDEYQVLRHGSQHSELGKRALNHIDAGEFDAARQWLNWAFERQNEYVGWFDQFEGTPFARIWVAANKSDEQTVRLATAALAVFSDRAEECANILKSSREGATETQRLQIDRALLSALIESDHFEEALQIASRLASEFPQALEPVMVRYYLLRDSGQLEPLREFAREGADRGPHQEPSLLVLAEVSTAQHDQPQATDYLRQLSERPTLSFMTHIEASWLNLFLNDQAAASLTHARKAVEFTQEANPEALFLLALASAENGELLQATNTLALIHTRFGMRNTTMERLVWGGIAEHCGLSEIATKTYRQITRPEHKFPNSGFDLAQLRLKRIANGAEEDGSTDNPPSVSPRD